MATSQSNIVCDASTLANFKAWGQAISGAFSTFGWTQTADTGQVNWSTISTVPGANAYVYEIWKPGDALTAFYVRIEYGNFGATNSPALRLSLGTSTNGAGTLTGFNFGPIASQFAGGFTPTSSSTQYECSFSGANNRIGVMMWRNAAATGAPIFFAIERSLDSTGSPTSTYATLWMCVNNTSSGGGIPSAAFQQSLVFATGASVAAPVGGSNSASGGWAARVLNPLLNTFSGGSTIFNSLTPMDTCSPMVGFFDYPCTVCGVAWGNDITEAIAFSVTLYGATRTYYPSKVARFNQCGPLNESLYALCMRYD